MENTRNLNGSVVLSTTFAGIVMVAFAVKLIALMLFFALEEALMRTGRNLKLFVALFTIILAACGGGGGGNEGEALPPTIISVTPMEPHRARLVVEQPSNAIDMVFKRRELPNSEFTPVPASGTTPEFTMEFDYGKSYELVAVAKYNDGSRVDSAPFRVNYPALNLLTPVLINLTEAPCQEFPEYRGVKFEYQDNSWGEEGVSVEVRRDSSTWVIEAFISNYYGTNVVCMNPGTSWCYRIRSAIQYRGTWQYSADPSNELCLTLTN